MRTDICTHCLNPLAECHCNNKSIRLYSDGLVADTPPSVPRVNRAARAVDPKPGSARVSLVPDRVPGRAKSTPNGTTNSAGRSPAGAPAVILPGGPARDGLTTLFQSSYPTYQPGLTPTAPALSLHPVSPLNLSAVALGTGLALAVILSGGFDFAARAADVSVPPSPEYLARGASHSIAHTAKDIPMRYYAPSDVAYEPDYTGAVFAAAEPQPCPVDAQLEAYIRKCNPKVDAYHVALLLTEAARSHDLDPLLLVSIARFESTYRTNARGLVGERGLLQIHPIHRQRMAGMGLSFNEESDRLYFGAHMIRERLDDGAGLYAALRPWSVRRKAYSLYEGLKKQKAGRRPGLSTANHPMKGDS